MGILFAENLRKLRISKGLSQRELAELVHVTRSTVARWENSSRLPDAAMIFQLSKCFGTDVSVLLSAAAAESEEAPNVIVVDDSKLFLEGAMPVFKEVLPSAVVTGFTRPSEAIEYARANRIALAFLDIKMGQANGLELCRALLELNPCTNVIYLTAYIEYSFDAWSTGASGFALKPITADGVLEQLKNLRYPFSFGGGGQT